VATSNVVRTCARAAAGSSRRAAWIASGSWSEVSQTIPVTPSTTTSGTEPRRSATTGVPQAIASIITMPNGSSQTMGKTRAAARESRSRFATASAGPKIVTSGPSRGWMWVAK
jgi:hypothetical protein